jgi:hypothetical protein
VFRVFLPCATAAPVDEPAEPAAPADAGVEQAKSIGKD